MLLAIASSKPSSGLPTPGVQSPLRVCLKFLQEGHAPVAALELVAEWGQGDVKLQFEGYVKQLKQGRPLEKVLEEIALADPSPATELLIASIEARSLTGHFPELAPVVLAESEKLEDRTRRDMEVVIGSARRWTWGLVWTGILGGAMLIIALPQYSHAFLESRVGRVVCGVAITLEIVGVLWAGMLLRLQTRIERDLTQP